MAYDPETIESARQRLGSIFGELRGHGALWHRTSIGALRKILESGGIRPNDGSFPNSYCQSELSYGRLRKAVSLFDFDSEPVDRVLGEECTWGQFLTDCGRVTVIIELDREALARSGRLELPKEIVAQGSVVIPAVEAVYHGIVSISAFRGCLAVLRNSGHRYRRIASCRGDDGSP
jgi:hypothetical protein